MTDLELQEALRAEESLAQEMSRYAGRWVAVDKDRAIVDSAPTIEELLTRVEPEGLDRILEVSREPTSACFY